MVDEALLGAAWSLPVAAIYRQAGWSWQRLRAMCGPMSVANVLRSLGEEVAPTRLFGFRIGGTTLDQLADVVARKSRHRATVLRDLTLERFHAELRQANDPAFRYVVNFDRRPLFGWGGGHHAPLIGYLTTHDLAFVLDVNRRVGPVLLGAGELYAAMSTRDPASGKSRGLLRVE
jgi:hypothetical protein